MKEDKKYISPVQVNDFLKSLVERIARESIENKKKYNTIKFYEVK